MKKQIVLTSCGVLFSIGMFAQTDTNKLPTTAMDFIKKNFSTVSVEAVNENNNWQFWEDEKYEVKLSNGFQLDFDGKGNIIEIESKNNEAIPTTALPSQISSYLQENYPGEKVICWEKQDKEQEVELANGTELEFDGNGNFKKID